MSYQSDQGKIHPQQHRREVPNCLNRKQTEFCLHTCCQLKNRGLLTPRFLLPRTDRRLAFPPRTLQDFQIEQLRFHYQTIRCKAWPHLPEFEKVFVLNRRQPSRLKSRRTNKYRNHNRHRRISTGLHLILSSSIPLMICCRTVK